MSLATQEREERADVVVGDTARELVRALVRDEGLAASRVLCKKRLEHAVEPGMEAEVAYAANEELQRAVDEVLRLKTRRVEIKQLIAERERKLMDWKSKFPRGQTPKSGGHIDALMRRGMPCVQICEVALSDNHNQTELCFRSTFARGLMGLSGFSHVWVISSVEPRRAGAEYLMATDGCSLRLTLAQIVEVDEARARVRLAGYRLVQPDEIVVDIKPYIPYCDAWPDAEDTSNRH